MASISGYRDCPAPGKGVYPSRVRLCTDSLSPSRRAPESPKAALSNHPQPKTSSIPHLRSEYPVAPEPVPFPVAPPRPPPKHPRSCLYFSIFRDPRHGPSLLCLPISAKCTPFTHRCPFGWCVLHSCQLRALLLISHSYPCFAFGTYSDIHYTYNQHRKARIEPVEFGATSEQSRCVLAASAFQLTRLFTNSPRICTVDAGQGGQLGSPGFNVANDLWCAPRRSQLQYGSHAFFSVMQDWLAVLWR